MVARMLNCPNDKKKMKGKTCEVCGTKNRYHHYIQNGFKVCDRCEGTGLIQEDKFHSPSQEVVDYMINHLEFKLWKDEKQKEKCESMDGEGGFLVGMYTQLFGCTDYSDHRNDSLEALKNAVKKNLDTSHQLIHYLKNENELKKTCLLLGYNGGYHGKLI